MSKPKRPRLRLTGMLSFAKPVEQPKPTAPEQPKPESVRIQKLKKLAQQMREEFERNPPQESIGKYDIRRAS